MKGYIIAVFQVLQTDINNIVDYDEEDQQAFVKNNFVTGPRKTKQCSIY